MAINNAPRPSIVATVLRDYRKRQGLSRSQLAARMIAVGFPSSQYSHYLSGSSHDLAYFTTRIRAIERFTLNDPWPFPTHEAAFIDAAASCLPNILWARGRLTWAMALDTLAMHDL